jgi:hypothetical protein
MAYGDLTSFDSLRQWLDVGTAVPTSDFPMLQGLITSASDWIHVYTNRFFPLADYEEVRDGSGGMDFVFANHPVVSVAFVTINGRDIPASQTALDFGYLFSPTRLSLRGYRFTRDRMNTVIRYRAGFAQIPPSIAQACNELVAKQYRERARIGVKQETIVGVDSYTYNVQDLLPNTRTALAQYCVVAPISSFSRRLAPTQTDPSLIAAAL